MRLQRLAPISFILALLVLPACDFAGDDETLAFDKEVQFRFEFSTDEGEEVIVTSTTNINIDDVLFGEGYERADIMSASIRSVTVERVQPVGTNLDVFDSISISLQAGGASPTHASSNNLPASSTASLSVASAGVTNIVKSPTFGARLTALPTITEDFVLTARVTLSISVQGI